ncbi:N-acetylornithine carbamoyltransferase [Aquimarina muelleri]|uniref:N-succinylornithine carbamoyltransferase n=1 Tax=Aquimarina muelleri TaxID=279356 RepID=A0A918N472_9FLAO|nr:N-acetylornithine carbamoyltransferase [Aquimarina muelleri]MCX2763531.1 N-acetylornithine carbamoyltransferase [Aquimarina muelleri]GGX25712.1 ornithine carbamoyltransferase [Aquimarina muelleri]
MNNYFSIQDIDSLSDWLKEAIEIKKKPLANKTLGKNKTIGLLFFNPSLRTRLSTHKAALNLGMHVIVMNFTGEGWSLEYEDGTIMDQGNSEHVKEAAQVVSQYCDVLAIRAFAKLKNREEDYREEVLNGFIKYASIPIINMESATGHPLQALTDAITITEYKKTNKPKVVLSWAPHPKALPQAVANSFVEMMQKMDANFVITHPKGFELDNKITKQVPIDYNQENALKDADFVYVKNWSSYVDYGKVVSNDFSWMMTKKKMELTNNGKFMHCLPVRRNVVVEDKVIDSENSIVIEQANNRTFAVQLVLKKILEKLQK